MKEFTYTTRICINGEYRELSREEAKTLLGERIKSVLQERNDKRTAGQETKCSVRSCEK